MRHVFFSEGYKVSKKQYPRGGGAKVYRKITEIINAGTVLRGEPPTPHSELFTAATNNILGLAPDGVEDAIVPRLPNMPKDSSDARMPSLVRQPILVASAAKQRRDHQEIETVTAKPWLCLYGVAGHSISEADYNQANR